MPHMLPQVAHADHERQTNLHAQSVSFKTGWFAGTLERLTIDCCYHFLLMDGVRHHLSLVARPSTAPSWCHGEAGIMDQMACLPAAGDGRECPLICCVMGPVNSCWTCSEARNIRRYNSSQYDSIRYTQYWFRYDTDPIIVCSLVITYQTRLISLMTTVLWCLSVKLHLRDGRSVRI